MAVSIDEWEKFLRIFHRLRNESNRLFGGVGVSYQIETSTFSSHCFCKKTPSGTVEGERWQKIESEHDMSRR